MSKQASGTFTVKMTPRPLDENAGDPPAGHMSLGRMSIDKQFRGDLEGSSVGQMLATSAIQGSAGYVAMERVTGSLAGRRGTFVLQHSGTLTRGAPTQSVTVVPDSGTGELMGLTGRMTIDIAGGKHSYRFEYTPGD